ncbi:TPA: hypothetical protein N0F65_008915 [Lagenidium giganteum]|uniref:Transposase n=1 Tax=Lagenidium giganteum TaxID=4803 RepID=A0AAV2YUH9_9STRA|nr:TPA: hypothetical protein N0F65_008915 [Lagenidium giganteum]
MRRHKLAIRQRTRKGGIKPDDAAAIRDAFIQDMRELIATLNPTAILNADQTAVQFEILPKTTVTTRGAKTVWINSGGKEKVLKATPAKKPEVQQENNRLRHGFGRRLWKDIGELQHAHGVTIYGNKSG